MLAKTSCAGCALCPSRNSCVILRLVLNRYNRPSMPIDWFPLWLSLRVAVLSTAVALAAGLWIAYILANREFRFKEALDGAVPLPLVLPPTVLGYYLLVLIGRNSPIGQLWEKIFGSPLVFTWK